MRPRLHYARLGTEVFLCNDLISLRLGTEKAGNCEVKVFIGRMKAVAYHMQLERVERMHQIQSDIIFQLQMLHMTRHVLLCVCMSVLCLKKHLDY